MDERTKELISIGASIGARCQPCLDFHLGKARKLDIGEDEIKAAIEVGYMIEKGALSAMRNYVDTTLNQDQSQSGACCSGSKTKCCG